MKLEIGSLVEVTQGELKGLIGNVVEMGTISCTLQFSSDHQAEVRNDFLGEVPIDEEPADGPDEAAIDEFLWNRIRQLPGFDQA